MLVIRTFKTITKEVTWCGHCPWMELVPEMGMGPIPTCRHPLHPGEGGYSSAIPDEGIHKDCPFLFKSLFPDTFTPTDIYDVQDLLPKRPSYFTHKEPEGFAEKLQLWENTVRRKKFLVDYKGQTFIVSYKDCEDEISRMSGGLAGR